MAGIVGSVNVELETSYRIMLIKVANELSLDDCQQIAFVARLPSPTCHPEPGKQAIRLHLMSTLESLGHISPLKLDFLEKLMDAIGKRNLLDIIQSYKKNSLYKEAMRRLEEQDKKKKKGKRSGKQQTPIRDHSSEQMVKNSTERIRKLQESYATLLTQFSQVALLMRNALESEDQAQIEETFLLVAADGDAIARTLRKNLEEAGVLLKCGDEDSSGNDSQDNSPTDEDKNLEASLSPPPPARVESLNPQHHSQLTPESSPSPTLPRKPTPLPRKKRIPTQVSSPGSSLLSATYTPSTPHQFVFCQQETHGPSSLTAALHIPQSASTSCLTASADYSGDYSGGTGDSGVGDIRHKYTPSQEALDLLNPVRRQQSNQDHKEESSRTSGERSRYMKLTTKEEKCADGYTKPLRARSLDDFLNLKDDHW